MVDHENYSNIKSGDESKARVKVTFNLEFLFQEFDFRPLLTTPEREPWSRQNLMKRQKEPPEKQHQLVFQYNDLK